MPSKEGTEEDLSLGHGQFKKTFKRMMNGVVARGICSGCSMCIVTCPYGVIKYNLNSTIVLTKPFSYDLMQGFPVLVNYKC